MSETLEVRVGALERDMAEVKGEIASLRNHEEVKQPERIEDMIDNMIYSAVAEAYDGTNAASKEGSDRDGSR